MYMRVRTSVYIIHIVCIVILILLRVSVCVCVCTRTSAAVSDTRTLLVTGRRHHTARGIPLVGALSPRTHIPPLRARMGCARVSQVCVEISALSTGVPPRVHSIRIHVHSHTHIHILYIICVYIYILIYFIIIIIISPCPRRRRPTHPSSIRVRVCVQPAAAKRCTYIHI